MTAATPDDTVFARYPFIRLDRVNIEHYRALLERRLVLGRCDDCARWHTPLRPMCPSCWSTRVGPREVSGRGTVHLLTRLHQGPPDDDRPAPWPLAAVELVEQPGLRIVAPLLDTPRELQRIGQPVEPVWTERGGAPWPAFRAVSGRPKARPA